MPAIENKTLKEKLFWAYANLTITHIAISKNEKSYTGQHFGIRKSLYRALMDGTKRVGSLFDDEKVKMAVSASCCYCGSKDFLATEHVIPRSRGGSDSGDNLITACRRCNSSKRDKDMLAWFAQSEKTPSVLLYRRYLKLAIQYASEKRLLDADLNTLSKEKFPFEHERLLTKPIALSEAKLWLPGDDNLPKREKPSQTKTYSIANWNLEKPKSRGAKLRRALNKIRQLDPDLMVLTENSDLVELPEEYFVLHCLPSVQKPSTYSASIYSKWPIKDRVGVSNEGISVCGIVESPFGQVIVFGCIIPYHMSGVNRGKFKHLNYKAWQLHYEMIEVFKRDWERIQREYPGKPFIVMGDFNQTRGPVTGYGTAHGRQLLSDALSTTSLECVTEIDFAALNMLKPDEKGKVRNNIDHICVNGQFKEQFGSVEVDAWEHFDSEGLPMSDHNGVRLIIKRR